LTGWFLSSTVNFDPNHTNPGNPNNTLTDPSPGTMDLQFVAKYTSSSTFQWVTLLGRGNEFSGTIAVDVAARAVYVAYVDESNNNTHVAKLDAGSGTIGWNVQFAGNLTSPTGGPHAGVAIGPLSGDVYVTGRNTAAQAFVAKLDPAHPSTPVWNQTISGGSTEGLAVAVDSSEHVYAAYVSGNSTPVSQPGHKPPPPPPPGNIQVAKLDAGSGSTVWTGTVGVYANYGAGIAVDGPGNVYVAGGANPYFVAKFAPTNNTSLTQSWNEQISGNAWASGVAVDGLGNVYTTGSFAGSVDFDPGPGPFILQGQSGSFAGNYDVFVSKLDTNGNFVTAADIVSGSPANGGNNYGHGIAVDNSSPGSPNVYIAAAFRKTADFDPTAGTYNLTVVGGNTNPAQDMLVSKLTQPASPLRATRGGPPLADATRANQALAPLLVPGSVIDVPRYVTDGGSQGPAESLLILQEVPGTAPKSASPMTTLQPAQLHSPPTAAVDWLFADLGSDSLPDALLAPSA
jgi:hypothetical protein